MTALDSVKAECEKLGAGHVLTISCDLGREEECDQVVTNTVTSLGAVDILINNAGYLDRANFCDVTMKDIDLSMDVNLKSAFKLSQLCMPHLKQSKGLKQKLHCDYQYHFHYREHCQCVKYCWIKSLSRSFGIQNVQSCNGSNDKVCGLGGEKTFRLFCIMNYL